jgi:hypothetical protein
MPSLLCCLHDSCELFLCRLSMSIWQYPKVQSCFAFVVVATLGQISDLTRPFSCMLSLAEVENVESAAAHRVFFLFVLAGFHSLLLQESTKGESQSGGHGRKRSWPLLH